VDPSKARGSVRGRLRDMLLAGTDEHVEQNMLPRPKWATILHGDTVINESTNIFANLMESAKSQLETGRSTVASHVILVSG